MTRVRGLLAAVAAAFAVVLPGGAGAQAQTVIEEWSAAKFPPPPALKPATIVANETDLVMDFTNQSARSPRFWRW